MNGDFSVTAGVYVTQACTVYVLTERGQDYYHNMEDFIAKLDTLIQSVTTLTVHNIPIKYSARVAAKLLPLKGRLLEFNVATYFEYDFLRNITPFALLSEPPRCITFNTSDGGIYFLDNQFLERYAIKLTLIVAIRKPLNIDIARRLLTLYL